MSFYLLMGSNKQWAAFFLFITFTLSGFWHGAAWNFIIWGAYHGALLLVLRYFGRPFQRWTGKYVSQPQFVSWGMTFASSQFRLSFLYGYRYQPFDAEITNFSYPLDLLFG